ncbi:beta-ketoacyl synthase [Weeksellaceae bacterium TAE3-ERU29]|nr:beta-ketoacyl synthase [Weeksellaceae bacterium TAE3-ERU29]
MDSKIVITKYNQISCVDNFSQLETGLIKHKIGEDCEWVGKLSIEKERELQYLLNENPNYLKLDRTVHLALLCASEMDFSNINKSLRIGVNLGSSRGATNLLEKEFTHFLQENKVDILTSPVTSLGNLSSWVGQYLGFNGIRFSHSMTCSTSLLSVANAVAWLKSNMADKMLVGGSEAPLTPFTVAQSKALRIYSREEETPSLAGNLDKKSNTMVLGEGAGLLLLEKETEQNQSEKLAEIVGIGYASEPLSSATGITENAENFQQSMRMALEQANLETVDAIITHTPGTRKGDQAEWNAVKAVFPKELPFITNNKWKIGHTFGAAGVLSLIYGLKMMINNQFYLSAWDNKPKENKPINTVLINAAGFGGNAVSVIIKK